MTTMNRIRTTDAEAFPLWGHLPGARGPSNPGRGGFWLALRAALTALNVKTADAEQVERELQGVARIRGIFTRDVLEGNAPQKRIALGTVWTPSQEALRDSLVDAIAALEAGKNRVPGEPDEVGDLSQYIETTGLAKTYAALAEDALARAKDQGGACDNPKEHEAPPMFAKDARTPTRSKLFDPSPAARYAENLKKRGEPPTTDARPTNRPQTLAAASRGAVVDYAKNLSEGRKKSQP